MQLEKQASRQVTKDWLKKTVGRVSTFLVVGVGLMLAVMTFIEVSVAAGVGAMIVVFSVLIFHVNEGSSGIVGSIWNTFKKGFSTLRQIPLAEWAKKVGITLAITINGWLLYLLATKFREYAVGTIGEPKEVFYTSLYWISVIITSAAIIAFSAVVLVGTKSSTGVLQRLAKHTQKRLEQVDRYSKIMVESERKGAWKTELLLGAFIVAIFSSQVYGFAISIQSGSSWVILYTVTLPVLAFYIYLLAVETLGRTLYPRFKKEKKAVIGTLARKDRGVDNFGVVSETKYISTTVSPISEVLDWHYQLGWNNSASNHCSAELIEIEQLYSSLDKALSSNPSKQQEAKIRYEAIFDSIRKLLGKESWTFLVRTAAYKEDSTEQMEKVKKQLKTVETLLREELYEAEKELHDHEYHLSRLNRLTFKESIDE